MSDLADCPKCGRATSLSVEPQGTYLICEGCSNPCKACGCERIEPAERYQNQCLPEELEQE